MPVVLSTTAPENDRAPWEGARIALLVSSICYPAFHVYNVFDAVLNTGRSTARR